MYIMNGGQSLGDCPPPKKQCVPSGFAFRDSSKSVCAVGIRIFFGL